MQYSMGKLVQELDNIDALECLGFATFDSLCMGNNLSSVVYFKTDSSDYFIRISKSMIHKVSLERDQYLRWRKCQNYLNIN